ncbi:FKBP-type peptidyl-prolyl cis-trans isomerase [Microbacterium sp. LMI1-1-1.1]|uniref:FKBP-type peptidyl-prolyl cis-trans isomerase n=1 Tax=Microbacterium sp. LMI1-1-1.1 TaxID=3135223 RepID=UPI003465E438
MRRLPAFVAVTALAGFGLVGCSASAASSCPAPTSDARLDDLVTVSGDFGEIPDVELRTPFVAEDRSVETVIQGDGTRITEADQTVLLDLTVYNGETGERIVSSRYDGNTQNAQPLSVWDQTFPDFSGALLCATEGSRLVVSLPYDSVGEQAATGLGIPAGGSAVVVADVRRAYLAAADGADQFTSGFGLPSVVRAPDGQPGVTIPDGDAPSDVVVQTLKKGDGAEVTADAITRIHVLGVGWTDRRQFVSTWDTAPVAVQPSQLPESVASALEGQTVGSQVLVVVPADDTTEEQSAFRAPADTALVFVIDVLGVDD